MPEDMPDRLPEEMPRRVPEDMPDRMADRMPEDMSDRMPEDLPVTKRINVMVGITRSKVVYFDFTSLFGIDVLFGMVCTVMLFFLLPVIRIFQAMTNGRVSHGRRLNLKGRWGLALN